MSDIALKVENLSKVYRLYDNPVDRLKESLHPFKKSYHRDFYALRDISFEIKKGETVGIIGKNGSGKSTLLKILTGVLTPTNGNVYVNGKVSALLELGTGFNPELTGIENVYFSGTIMGYKKQEMDAKLDGILSFADIGEFVHQPVKTYSSGMFVRLAFAVAINVDPEILIVDEALSVGDMRFQQKSIRKMKSLMDNAKSILFVTHDMGTVLNFCKKAMWLTDGKINDFGNPDFICKKYVAYMTLDNITNEPRVKDEKIIVVDEDIIWESTDNCAFFGEGGAKIKRVTLCNSEETESLKILKGGEKVKFLAEIEILRDIPTPIFGILLNDELGNHITGINSYFSGDNFRGLVQGETIIVNFEFEFPKLKAGNYLFSVALAEGTQLSHIQHHWVHDVYIVTLNYSDVNSLITWYLVLKNTKVSIKEN